MSLFLECFEYHEEFFIMDVVILFSRVENLGVEGNWMQFLSYIGIKDGILEERKYRIIDRNYTPFRSNVHCRRRMYLAIIERRLQRRDKDIGVESDLLNDLGFNLYVTPWSPVVRLVAYFGVRKVAKTEVLRSRVKESE